MKIRLYYPSFDPGAAESLNIESKLRFQGTDHEFENGLLDGLISDRVALLDFDPETGELAPGVKIVPPKPGRKLHSLSLSRSDLKDSPKSVQAIQALCFGTVLRTIGLIEHPRALGRRIAWGFDGHQLLIVPRAGYQANAFYHRGSHSLQFFFVSPDARPSDGANGQLNGVYTALSPDIVAHEAAHALVDGIAPHLYNAASPQSLALHEAIADLTSLIFSLRTRNFVTYVLDRNDGELEPELIGSIAEEIGALSAGADTHSSTGGSSEHRHYLRNLHNRFALADEEGQVSAGMRAIASDEPHDLSQVLSGALFDLLLELFKEAQSEETQDKYANSGYALSVATTKLTAVIYRALDYLPPGEISFADFGRAMLAADEVVWPDTAHSSLRTLLKAQLLRRGIGTGETLSSYRNFVPPDLSEETLERFADGESDWKVYDFVNRYSNLFRIPDNTPFQVHKALVLNKVENRPKTAREIEQQEGRQARHEAASEEELADPDDGPDGDEDLSQDGSGGHLVERSLRELLIKVSWRRRETIRIGHLEREFEFLYGTTVSFDLEEKRVLVRLTTNSDGFTDDHDMASQKRQRDARQNLISEWLDAGLLSEMGDDSSTPQLITTDGVCEVRNMAHMLHVAGGTDLDLPEWMTAQLADGGEE